jgi:hypothetical protein
MPPINLGNACIPRSELAIRNVCKPGLYVFSAVRKIRKKRLKKAQRLSLAKNKITFDVNSNNFEAEFYVWKKGKKKRKFDPNVSRLNVQLYGSKAELVMQNCMAVAVCLSRKVLFIKQTLQKQCQLFQHTQSHNYPPPSIFTSLVTCIRPTRSQLKVSV